MSDAFLSPAELADIKAYHAPIYAFALVKLVLASGLTVGAVVWARSLYGLAGSLERRARALLPAAPRLEAAFTRIWGNARWAQALAFIAVLAAIDFAAYLPTDLYFGFFRERAFGLATESLGSFLVDYAKGTFLANLALGAVTLGLFGLARRTRHWWLILSVVCSGLLLVSTALDPFRARLYFKQHPLPAGELRERITALMGAARIDFEDVLVEETAAKTVRLQAYFAGEGPTRTIVLNDSLLEKLEPEEVLAAVAHEAGHVHESRWPRALGSALALTAFLAIVEVLLRTIARRGWWGVSERADVRALPLILLVFWVCSMLGGPFAGAFQREREREADRFAVRLTGNPAAFRSLLIKVARINKMDPDPPRWIVLKGWSHPPIGERLELLDALPPGKTEGGPPSKG